MDSIDAVHYFIKSLVSPASLVSESDSRTVYRMLVHPLAFGGFTSDETYKRANHLTIRDKSASYLIHRLDMLAVDGMETDLLGIHMFDPANLVPGGMSPKLEAFWKEYGPTIMDSNPIQLYTVNVHKIEHYMEEDRDPSLIVYMMGVLFSRVETARMLEAYKLTETWKDRYSRSLNGEVTRDDIIAWYNELVSPDIQSFHFRLPVYPDIRQELVARIEEAINDTMSLYVPEGGAV